jgi:PAS domain S-box-containing protein
VHLKAKSHTQQATKGASNKNSNNEWTSMGYQINPPSTEALRRMAHERLGMLIAPDTMALTSAQMHKLLEDMAIRKIEVEIQNEYLQNACRRLDMALSEAADLYDCAPIACFSTDMAGNIRKLNLAAASLLGQERHLLMSRNLADLLPPQQRERIQGLMLEATRTGAEQRCDIGLLAGKDQGQLARLIVSPLAPGQGHLLTLTEINAQQPEVEDFPADPPVGISDLQRAEEELLQTKGILQALFESLPQYLAVLDGEAHVLQTNALWNTYALSTGHAYRNGFDNANYAALIDGVTGGVPATNRAVMAGIADVITGKTPSFQMEYVFQSGLEKRLFVMHAMAVRDGRARAVVSHLELSRFKTDFVQRVTRAVRHRAA